MKWIVLLIVLFVCGVPAVVFFTVNSPNRLDDAVVGRQPGGTVLGIVHDERGGALRGVVIEGIPASRPQPGETPTFNLDRRRGYVLHPERALRFESRDDGTFSVQLEPYDGVYVLRASAPTFQTRERCFSFLDGDQRALDVAPPIEFTLTRAARLVVNLAERDGSTGIEGHYSVEHEKRGFWDLRPEATLAAGAFREGRIEVDALPRGEAHLSITTRDGKRFEEAIDLQPGEQSIDVRL